MTLMKLQGDESARLVRKEMAGSLPVLSPAGTLRLRELIGQAAWPAFLFVFVLLMHVQNLRFNWPVLTWIVTWVVAIIIFAWPCVAVVVYAQGIWRTISNSVARLSAVVFWMYWPICRLIACIVAVVLSSYLGNNLWFNNFRLYEEYYQLQAYDNVDSYTITGTRLQDAGLVQFNASDGVDRSRAGCIVNGDTYCIAPIIRGGQVQKGVKQSETGVLDLFMAGVNCCNCPVTDFRCGDWDDATATQLGGMRLLDTQNNKMFRLAVEKWTTNFGKVMQQGVFFQWTNKPITTWNNLWTRGLHLATLYCILGVLGSMVVMTVLNGFVRVLIEFELAAPINEHPPLLPGQPHGVETFKRGWIPHEYRHYLDQREPTGEHGKPDPTYTIL